MSALGVTYMTATAMTNMNETMYMLLGVIRMFILNTFGVSFFLGLARYPSAGEHTEKRDDDALRPIRNAPRSCFATIACPALRDFFKTPSAFHIIQRWSRKEWF